MIDTSSLSPLAAEILANAIALDPRAVVREFDIRLSRKGSLEASLTKLTKRAARKGLPVVGWAWGKAYTEEVWLDASVHVSEDMTVIERSHMSGNVKVRVSRIPLVLSGRAVKYDGWSFVACLQHLEGENIVRTVPGAEVPARYRTRGPCCDHCNVSRRRNDTYVLQHEDGRTVQVGSTCIRDFLGSDVAGEIAFDAEQFTYACALAGSDLDECGGGFGGGREYTSDEYLAYVAWEVRENGWKSRTAARDEGGQATADFAWADMTDSRTRSNRGAKPTADDMKLAADAAEWAENISDAAIEAERGDYLHNLRAASRTGLVTFRTAGIVASTITAYQRYLGRERQNAARAAMPKCDTHVGTIKQRLTVTARLDFVTGYETQYGYTTVLKFRTESGALLVWKASSTDVDRSCVGKTYTLTGTIVKHDEYKGEKQTMVNRCKLVEIQPSAQAA